MPTLFLAFANSTEDPLPTLQKELEEVNRHLNERKLKEDFIVHSLPFASTDSIIKDLRQFKEEIEVFLYSGHAGKDHLELEGGAAHAEGIAALLGRCPNLQLVILNGCSTKGQVAALLEKGIPMVIATSAPINDFRATQFSITFFEEMAVNRAVVKQAYQAAIDAAKVKGLIDSETGARGIILRNNRDKAAPLWGLYYQDHQEDLINNWTISEKAVDASFTNQYIQNAIAGIYEQFETTLTTQGETGQMQDVILKRLPYSISEPIRKLLAPGDNSGQLFYDRPSTERFRMLIYAYRSMIAFISYVLLAQLWQLKRTNGNNTNTDRLATILKTWLHRDYLADTTLSPLPLFKELSNFFEKNEIPYFLQELKQSIIDQNIEEIRESFDYFEKKIQQNPQIHLDRLCEVTEQHLAVILYHFGFLINYSLTSIKDISVLYYQHNTAPNFEHKVVKLQQALTNLEERTELGKNHYKSATIVLKRVQDKTNYLYLSPFFIDENAYTKTPKAKLCSFVAYNSANKQFYFRHVSKPNELITIEKKRVSIMAKIKGNTDLGEDYYPLINGQFSAFCQTVLGAKLEEL